jgi:hypothetical protein
LGGRPERGDLFVAEVTGSSMTERYGLMTASFLLVLILQRMLYENETEYIDALERTWTNGIALRGYLLEGALGSSHAKEIETPMGAMGNPQSQP